LLAVLATQDLMTHVAPIQLAMRLLLPTGSTLLTLPEMRPYLQDFDASALTYRWVHPDAHVDQLCDEALKLVQSGEAETVSRSEIFARLWAAAHKAAGLPAPAVPEATVAPRRGPIPYLDEPWYC
jgi:hypothetical protein